MPIKAIARTLPSSADVTHPGVTWLAADVLNSTSLNEALDPGDVVINLVYAAAADEAENVHLMDNLIDACLCRRVARLVHCSTAVVAGAARSRRVVESTPCEPRTPYERTKWALEQRVLAALSRGLDVGILRPTAIVGPGGQNLVKLARSLLYGSSIATYLRACLFGRRFMHLVPVRNVAAALLHLAMIPAPLNGDTYLVSSDDDPDNNFESVEATLRRSLGLEPRRFPPMPLPPAVLSVFLGLRGSSDTDPRRLYDSTKLLATNFRPADSVATAVREFGETLRIHERS